MARISISISIPDHLHARLNRYRKHSGPINVSKICSAALERHLEGLEALPDRISALEARVEALEQQKQRRDQGIQQLREHPLWAELKDDPMMLQAETGRVALLGGGPPVQIPQTVNDPPHLERFLKDDPFIEPGTGRRLRQARKHRGLDMAQLADQLGIEISIISGMECNEEPLFRGEWLDRVCEILDCSPEWLLRGES